MRRPVARFLFVTLLGGIAMLLGIVTSLTLTPPGRDLLARTVSEGLDRVVTGHVDVGTISGSFLYDLTLERLVVRDTQGVLLADLPRVHVAYRIPNLLANRIVLSAVHVDNPVINLVKHRGGRMNYEEVLGLGQKKGGGGPGPLVEFYDVQVHNGTLRIALPWNPASHLRRDAQRDSALVAERAKPGRQIVDSREGLQRILRFEQLTTFMPRLRIATPDRQPFTIDLDTLATRISDPQVVVRDAIGRLRFRGDSAVFSFTRVALPNTAAAGGGAVTWPRDTILFDFQLDAPRIDLADLRWISPQFPDMTGRALVHAYNPTGARTEYHLRDLRMQDATGRQWVEGALVAVTDKGRGPGTALGVRDMALRHENLDLDVARAYLDTLPFYGTLTGTTTGSGWLIGPLDVRVDWAFADARVPGNPVSRVLGDGRIVVSQNPDSGLTFAGFNVRRSDISLPTVQRITPAVDVRGRLAATGVLSGPLQRVTFQGTAVHRDGDLPASTLAGRLFLDSSRDTLALSADLALEPLRFAGIRPSFPTLAAQGELRGRVVLDGTLDRMQLDATVEGEIGTLEAHGLVTMLPPKWAAEDLLLRFSDLDLAALRGTGPRTRLDGTLTATGSIDTLRAPEGELELALGRSRVREITLDSLYTRAALADSVIELDTIFAGWRGAVGGGSGTLGYRAPHRGTMRFTLNAGSLLAFDSLALAMSGLTRAGADTAARPLNGRLAAEVTVEGALDSLVATGRYVARALEFQQVRTPELRGDFVWRGFGRPSVTASFLSDSLAAMGREFAAVGLRLDGRLDSLGWAAGATVGLDSLHGSRVDAAGSFRTLVAGEAAAGGGAGATAERRLVTVDSLGAALPTRRWHLLAPVTVALSDSAPELTPVHIEAVDGSSAIQASGRWPGTSAGAVNIDARGIDLRDVYGLLGRDTALVGGTLGLDVRLAGTAAAPTIRGSATLAEARLGETRTPFLRAVVDYAGRRLDGTVRLWRTGEALLALDASLPLDLALTGVERRRLDGPLSVRARADSLGLEILEALTPAVRNVRGYLVADVRAEGTWAQPRLGGFVSVNDGAMRVTGMGVDLTEVRGRLALEGDSVTFDDVFLRSDGEGRLDVGGYVRFDSLTRPLLALDLRASRFHAIDVRNFLDVTVSGDVHLRGPVLQATMTGEADADRGVLYFADLLNKRVIDLSDPTNADVVDTLLVAQRNLGPAFQNRFIDSLRIEDFQFGVGGDFWLRSTEANIQLTGRDLLVDKVRDEYRINGTLNALRGTYNLQIGPVSRQFDVEQGSVTYEGSPDLNALVDISARHTVRTSNNLELPITASITGSLQQPRLELTSGPTIQPPIPEVDLISYLIFGVPSSQAQPSQLTAISNVAAYLSSTASNELERWLISDLGFPIDMLEIRPAVSFTGNQSSVFGNVTQLAAGWQIGQKVFLTLNAGFCGADQFGANNLGAGLEMRFSPRWRAQVAFEPTFQDCGVRGFGQQLGVESRYQIGADVFREWEF